LLIYGPTATGKTSLGIKLAKSYSGEIVSADSRQIYKGMDIGTGKDVGKKSKFHLWKKERVGKIGYYIVSGVKLWLLDVVDPDTPFSSYQWAELAKILISKISNSGSLPIVLGGSGFYLKTLLDGVSADTAPDWQFRGKMSKVPLLKLQLETKEKLSEKWATMNNSDRSNPRRLIRALEMGKKTSLKRQGGAWENNSLAVALFLEKSIQKDKISKRINERLKQGLLDELKILLKKYCWTDPGLNCLAYKEFKSFFERKTDLSLVVDQWFKDEVSYAKRQLNWFAKDERFTWFDVGQSTSFNQINKLVRKWYSNKDEKNNH